MFSNAIIDEIYGSEENLAQFKAIVVLKASLNKSDQSIASGSGGGSTESTRVDAGDSASASADS